MSGRVRGTALVAAAFVAGLFIAGSAGSAQQPAETPPTTPTFTWSTAVEWFRFWGVGTASGDQESIMPGFWTGWNNGYSPTAYVWGSDDQLESIVVIDATGLGESWEDLELLQPTVHQFLPVADAWFADALASSTEGSSATHTFGDVEIRYEAPKVTQVTGAVSITYH